MEKEIADFFKNKHVLITGSSGLIGSAFVNQLLECDARIRCLQHQRPIQHAHQMEIISGDLLYMATALKACQGIDLVIHAAGVSGGSRKVTRDPIPMFTYNLMMNTHLLEAARTCGVSRFLFISNSSVYASSNNVLIENDEWGQTSSGMPENETGMVKRIGETQCALYTRETDMQIAIMRAANAYGPHDNFDLDASHVIPALIRKAVEGQNPYKVWGDGSTVRDFIHTSDIARAGLFLVSQYAFAQPVNIATGHPVTIRDLLNIIFEFTDLDKSTIVFEKNAPPASPVKKLDIGRMKALGFQPHVRLRDGLRQTIAWYKKHGDSRQ